MIGQLFGQLINGMWSILNLGIEIDGFYLKFWYFPALYLLIDMFLVLIGYKKFGASREKTGNGASYKSKGDRNDD